MLDILLISSDDERASRISALVAQENTGHRLRTIRAGAAQLPEYRENTQKADLLIIDDVHLEQRDLAAVEAIAASAPRLSCLLVTPSLSQDWLVAAMRAGVRHVLSWPIDEGAFAAELSLIGEKKAEALGPVVVLVMDKGEVARYQKITQDLRNAGIRAEMYLGSSGMKAQMKYADKRNAPCAIIQGSDERAKGEVTIKDLIEGAKAAAAIKDNKEWKAARPAQFSVAESNLIDEVKKLIARHRDQS